MLFEAFRFLVGSEPVSWAPMMGSVGPSLEYGGVAVTVVVSLSFSDEDAKISLMRFGLAISATCPVFREIRVYLILTSDGSGDSTANGAVTKFGKLDAPKSQRRAGDK